LLLPYVQKLLLTQARLRPATKDEDVNCIADLVIEMPGKIYVLVRVRRHKYLIHDDITLRLTTALGNEAEFYRLQRHEAPIYGVYAWLGPGEEKVVKAVAVDLRALFQKQLWEEGEEVRTKDGDLFLAIPLEILREAGVVLFEDPQPA